MEIINRFGAINDTYRLLVNNSEEIFVALKEKNFEKLDLLNKERNAQLETLDLKLKQLKDEIAFACDELKIENNGIRSLEPFMELVEKEKVSTHLRDAFHLEKKLKNNTKMNQCLVEAMMNVSQTIMDTWVYVSAQEQQTNAFFNKKL